MRDQAIWLVVRQAMLMVCDAIERWYYLNSNARDKDIGQTVGQEIITNDVRSGSEKVELVKPKGRRTGVSSI